MKAPFGEKGIALVLTLAVLALITALVVEFSYGVFVNTGFLDNYQTSQRLSLTASSGVSLAAKFMEDALKQKYTYPGSMEFPGVDPFADGLMSVSMRLEDESSKFNINTIVFANGDTNEKALNAFKTILKSQELDEDIADSAADWIDADSAARLPDSEAGAKNSAFQAVDELLNIKGMDTAALDKLKSIVTVYGSGLININGAEPAVLSAMSELMDQDISGEMAENVVLYRENKPFETKTDILKVTGFNTAGIPMQSLITVKGEAFRVIITASSQEGVKRIIECVLDASERVLYWKEI